jgi:cytosine/adenosine deaminase-related metal-dependent hydrolase
LACQALECICQGRDDGISNPNDGDNGAYIPAAHFDNGKRASAQLIGLLAPGMKADIAILDLDTLALTPLNDVKRRLVYSSVRHVIIDGHVVVRDGAVTTVDEKAPKQEAELMRRLY